MLMDLDDWTFAHDERRLQKVTFNQDLGSQSNWKTRLDSGFGRGIAIYEFMVKKTLVG